MKVLIVGTRDFLGFSLAKRFLELGHKVYGMDITIDDKSITELQKVRLNFLKSHSNFSHMYLGDHDYTDVSIFGNSVDYVFYYATRPFVYTNKELESYVPYLQAAVIMSTKIFELAKKLKAKKFIYDSSHSVYGNARKEILTEKKIIPKPNSPHGAAYLAGEKVLEYLCAFNQLPTLIFRAFTVYGPYLSEHVVVTHFLEKLYYKENFKMYSDPNRVRDFIYIDDYVNFVIASLNKRLKFQIINIASGNSYSLKEVAYLIGENYQVDKDKIIFDKSPFDFSKVGSAEVRADISRAKKMLGYKPKTSIEDGIKKTYEWYIEGKFYENRYHR